MERVWREFGQIFQFGVFHWTGSRFDRLLQVQPVGNGLHREIIADLPPQLVFGGQIDGTSADATIRQAAVVSNSPIYCDLPPSKPTKGPAAWSGRPKDIAWPS